MARRARVASRTGVSRGARVTARVVRRRARRSTRAVLDRRARRACACGVVLPGRARAHRDPSLHRAGPGTTGVARAGVRHAAVNPYDPALGTLRAAIARIARGALRANRIVARRARDLSDAVRHRSALATASAVDPGPGRADARARIGDPARGHVARLAASTGATDLASPTDGVIRRGAGHTFGAPDHSGARDTRVAHAIGPIAAHALIAVGHPVRGAGVALVARPTNATLAALRLRVALPVRGAGARHGRVGVGQVEPVLHAVTVAVARAFTRIDDAIPIAVTAGRRVAQVDLFGVVDAVTVRVRARRIRSAARPRCD